MMALVRVVVAVFSLLSLGQSAPVSNCDDLLRPVQIQGRDQLLGTWTYIGESTDVPGAKLLTKMFVDSVVWNVTFAEQDNRLNSLQIQKSFGMCFSLSYSMTVENNSVSMVHPYPSTGFLLNTICPDCIVVSSNYSIGRSSYRALQFLSRRTKVSATELEEFAKQVECLNLPAATILDPEKGFCTDSSVSKQIDLSSTMNTENLNFLDKLLNSEKGVQAMVESLSELFGSKTGQN